MKGSLASSEISTNTEDSGDDVVCISVFIACGSFKLNVGFYSFEFFFSLK